MLSLEHKLAMPVSSGNEHTFGPSILILRPDPREVILTHVQ